MECKPLKHYHRPNHNQNQNPKSSASPRRVFGQKIEKNQESSSPSPPMACASQSMISANSCSFTIRKISHLWRQQRRLSTIAATPQEPDCNVEECAPDKEVGKVSMEWLAGEKTKVSGTYPPRKKWSGYVEKDTAGQTNIYSVEPSVYVAESVISSGTAGTSAEGTENTAAIAAGLALILVAAASSILLQVSKNTPRVQIADYSGPPLSYYISKFKPAEIVEEAPAVPVESQSSETIEASIPSEAEPQATLDVQPESNVDVVAEVQVEL